MEDKNKGQVILYQTEDGQTKLEVQFKNETVWLSLDQIVGDINLEGILAEGIRNQ